MTMLYLMIVCALVLILARVAMTVYKSEREKDLEGMMYPQAPTIKKGARSRLQEISFTSLSKEKSWLISIPAAILVGFLVWSRGGSFLVGAIIGGVIPWIIVTQMKRNYEVAYRDGGKTALEFLGAVLAAGGSLEEWVEEVIPRLDGPLRTIFQRGYQNLRDGLSIKVFLEGLIKSSPDSYLQLVFSGLLHEYNESGDMPRFVDEVLRDMINQDKFERAMKLHRQSGQNMLIYITAFPVFLYMLFYSVINHTMELHPWTMIVFVLGVAGYIGFIWLGLRVTKPKMS